MPESLKPTHLDIHHMSAWLLYIRNPAPCGFLGPWCAPGRVLLVDTGGETAGATHPAIAVSARAFNAHALELVVRVIDLEVRHKPLLLANRERFAHICIGRQDFILFVRLSRKQIALLRVRFQRAIGLGWGASRSCPPEPVVHYSLSGAGAV
jgi:hypothetical protein